MPRTWVECAVQVMKDSLDKHKLWTVVEILQDISKKDLKRVSGRNSYLALFSALMDDIQKPTGFFERQDGKFTLKFSKTQMQSLTKTLEVIRIENEGATNTKSISKKNKDTQVPLGIPNPTRSNMPGSSSNLPIDLTSDDVNILSTHISDEEQISDTEYPFPTKLTQLERQTRKLKREAQIKMWKAREEREAREMRAQQRRQRLEVSQPVSFQSDLPKARVNFALNANQVYEYTL